MQQVGIDIVEIARIERAVERWGKGFLARVYTEPEIERYGGDISSLAARFSGKEAVIKALGTRRIALKEIEILSTPGGKPTVRLYGRAWNSAENIGLSSLAISLSHCRQYAVACAIGETD
ncbi:MAG TPA: holo-[acyl-carrier-protein] synthase [Dehalococcoidia bacterium]|nr:holo-[acyl-carrier-protein] synthase [Dehalococcoidia bacterium]